MLPQKFSQLISENKLF
ncbi:hypothetical protein [Coxiella endosymbiont of Ornithodoros amblus]|nr:hypothetical protein [Coxiella endosymbiont of Ornithodoros amblus]